MITAIIILSILVIGLLYLSYKAIKKNFYLQDVIDNSEKIFNFISSKIKESNDKLSVIDANQAFESDDEVGYFFKELKNIQIALNEFNLLYDSRKREKQN